MSSSRAGAKMNKMSDEIKELDNLLLKTKVENYQKTAIIAEKQIQLLKTENAKMKESILNLRKREQEITPHFNQKRLKKASFPKMPEEDSRCVLCKQTKPEKKKYSSKSYAFLD